VSTREFYAARRRAAITNSIVTAGDRAVVAVWERADGIELRSPCCGAPTRVLTDAIAPALVVHCGRAMSRRKGTSNTGGCRRIYAVVVRDHDAVWTWSGGYDGQ